jgi:hypothetical protein
VEPVEPDVCFGALTFYRKKCPDGLTPRLVDAGNGKKAIRLAVKTGAYLGPLDDPRDNVNDRCELREAKYPFGTKVWYRFSIRVPDDFPKKQLRFIAASFKLPYDISESGSPAFALRIDERRWLATIEHLYEPKDKINQRYLSDPESGDCGRHAVAALDHHNFDKIQGDSQLQVRAVMATDDEGIPPHAKEKEFTMCTTGVEIHRHGTLPRLDDKWTDFVLHFSPSGEKDIDGLFELYVNETRHKISTLKLALIATMTVSGGTRRQPLRCAAYVADQQHRT